VIAQDMTARPGAPEGVSEPTYHDAAGQAAVTVPDAAFLSDAHYVRHGSDLHAADAAGRNIVVRGYFAADPAPDLVTADGTRAASPEMIESFVLPSTAGQYAQLGAPASGPQIGQVSELSGRVFVVRADGTRVELGTGDPLYQGDVIETAGSDSAVRILLVDQTTFAIGPDARLALDQLSFNPQDHSGEVSFSMLKGVFIFTSGLVAKKDPSHMTVNTPVASIGIRGTVVTGNLDDLGGQFTVLNGSIMVETNAGTVTMSQSGATTQVTNINAPPASVFVLSPTEYAAIYKAVSSVAPGVYLQQPAPENQDTDTPGQPHTGDDQQGSAGSVGQSVAKLLGPDLIGPGAFDTLAQLPSVTAQLQQILAELTSGEQPPALPLLASADETLPDSVVATVATVAPSLFDFSGAGGPVNFLGNDNDEIVVGSPFADSIDTQGGNDTVTGNNGSDVILGGAGNDILNADNGVPPAPIVHQFVTTAAIPALADGQAVDPAAVNGVASADLTLQADNPVTVTFQSEGAGQQNALGYYTIDADGTIGDVQFVWENASAAGSGGELQAGDSVQLDVGAGDTFGFFLVANSGLNDFSQLQNGSFEFRDANGNPATVATANPSLYFVSADGATEIQVQGAVFHTENPGLNADGIHHAVSGLGDADGQLVIGFEDLSGGGDRDYQDLVVTVDIAPIAAPNADSDFVDGGPGNDLLIGNAGDTLLGGDGDDLFQAPDLTFTQIAGGAGTDTLQFTGAGESFNLGQLAANQVTGIERIDLTGGANATLTIDANTVLSLTDGVNALTGQADSLVIDADAGDQVVLGDGWSESGTTTIGDQSYTVYDHAQSGAQVAVEQQAAQV
jgi:hypothetical protein